MLLSFVDARIGLHRSSGVFASRDFHIKTQGLSSVLEVGDIILWRSAALKSCLTVWMDLLR